MADCVPELVSLAPTPGLALLVILNPVPFVRPVNWGPDQEAVRVNAFALATEYTK